jgi:transmembrane sensor
MDQARIDQLIEKYLLKTATVAEQQELLDWYNSQNELGVIWNAGHAEEEEQIKARLLMNINAATRAKHSKLFTLSRIAVAAAAVAAVVFGVWFYNSRHLDDRRDLLNYATHDVPPGKNGATITLASGKVIPLSGAKTGIVVGADDIRYSDNTPLSPQGGSLRQGERGIVQNLTASTAKGQTYQFTLPDGTKVWLNADSKISFPSQFNGKERKILLTGEAYFAVVHNAKQPFRVESKGPGGNRQLVEDIGTEFNINAYVDESSTRTTLVEGSASVNDVLLKPSQQSILTSADQIKVVNVDTELAVAWKNNQFLFEDEELGTIMRMIGRWYNVEVEFTDDIGKEKFGGGVSRFDKVSKVLKSLEETGKAHFKIQGRKIYVGR